MESGVKITVALCRFYPPFKKREFKDAEFDTSIPNLFFMFFILKLCFKPQLPHSQCLWSGKNVEILTLTQTQIDSQIFLLPWLVPARSKFSQIRGSLKVIPSWKNIIFEHEMPTRSADGDYIIKDTHIAFSLTLHFSLRVFFVFFFIKRRSWRDSLGGLTCKGCIGLDGGELEGHLMLVSVDEQMVLWLEALSNKRWPTKKVPIKTETVKSAVL